MVVVGEGSLAVSFVVVSSQSAGVLPTCLPSLEAQRAGLRADGLRSEVIVVDNASRDGSADLAAEFVPDARVLRLPRNLGYGAAVNRGAARARGQWLAACNADLDFPPDGLAALPDVLAGAPDDVALLGPALLDADGASQPSVGRWPTLAGLVGGLLRVPAERRARTGRVGDVPWVSGACLLLRQRAFAEVRGFDEAFFLYYEEVDLAARLAARGWRCRHEPALRVVHSSPLHGRRRDAALREVVARSRRRYFERHRPAWESRALAVLERVERAARGRDAEDAA